MVISVVHCWSVKKYLQCCIAPLIVGWCGRAPLHQWSVEACSLTGMVISGNMLPLTLYFHWENCHLSLLQILEVSYGHVHLYF